MTLGTVPILRNAVEGWGVKKQVKPFGFYVLKDRDLRHKIVTRGRKGD